MGRFVNPGMIRVAAAVRPPARPAWTGNESLPRATLNFYQVSLPGEQGGGETKDEGSSSTVIVGRLEGRAVASHPGIDRHEFRNEAGYSALQDGCVSAYHVFGHDLRLVVLSDDWWKRKLR